MIRIFLYLSLLLALSACQQGHSEGKSTQQASSPAASTILTDNLLAQAMIGTWQSVSLDITMPGWNNTDSTSYISANESNWESVMQIKPVITVFNNDFSYHAEYYDLAGQLVNRPTGTWEVRGNTLVYHEESPVPMTFQQQVERVNDTEFRFLFQMDYDQDGLEDDQGVGISRKIN